MQFQLSVFYKNAFLSYLITSEDKVNFHFQLKSAPPGATGIPDIFVVTHTEPQHWNFDRALDPDLQKEVVKTMKRTKL
jgi:hypothetical protein